MTNVEGGAFYGGYAKKANIDLFVMRVNKADEISNARPCINCLKMMKAVGINKVYYSISDDEVICEKVSNMVSIHVSAASRQIPLHSKCNITEFYEKILSLHFPQNIKKYNLELFIKYNLLNVLPTYNCLIKDTYVYIYNEKNICIINSRII